MYKSIKDEDLTFVIQGKFESPTLVYQIKKHYPNSKIIISCWHNDDVDPILENVVDDIVKSADPDGFIDKKSKVYLNVNRQIVSTINGLEKVKTEYAIKLRSDLNIRNNNIIDLLNASYNYERNDGEFEHWVLALDLTTINFYKIKRLLSICDWFYVGKTKDLKKLFNINLYPKEYFCFYDETVPNKHGYISRQKFNAEQWIIINAFERALRNIPIEHGFATSNELDKVSERIYFNEFIIYSMNDFGIESTKYKWYQFKISNMLTHFDWIRGYNNTHDKKITPNIKCILKSALLKIATADVVYKLKRKIYGK